MAEPLINEGGSTLEPLASPLAPSPVLVRRLVSAFRIPPSLAELLGAMLIATNITEESLEEAGIHCKNLKVSICRLREELAPYEIRIKSRRFCGYWIEPPTKQRIHELAGV